MRWFIAFLLVIACVHAANYAEVTADISSDGTITFDGITNIPALQGTTDALTTKTGEVWTFNVTTDYVEDFIVTFVLPEGSVITYIKSSAPVAIGDDAGRPFVRVTGSNDILAVTFQYTVKESQSHTWWWLLLLLLIPLPFLFKRKPKTYDVHMLSDRQRLIVQVLEKESPLTQKQIEERVQLPKSSVSRNIDALVKKGILVKEQAGMSNKIALSRVVPPSSGKN